MPGAWAGSYSMELVTSTPHAAVPGHRAIIDLDILGDVTVLAPAPTDNGSFSVWFKNINRQTLTVDGNGESLQALGGPLVTSFPTTLKDGVIGFVWSGVAWLVSDFNAFEVPLGITAGATFTPRGSNGLCTLADSYKVTSVERTALGTYLMTGTDFDNKIISPVLNTIGHAANMHPTWTLQDKTATTVELLVGLRNPGGPFNAHDLDQDPSNTISILIERLA